MAGQLVDGVDNAVVVMLVCVIGMLVAAVSWIWRQGGGYIMSEPVN